MRAPTEPAPGLGTPAALRALFEGHHEAVVVVDAEGRCADLNEAALRLLGSMSPDREAGLAVRTPDGSSPIDGAEWTLRGADGSPRRVRCAVLDAGAGECLIVLRDVTAERRREALARVVSVVGGSLAAESTPEAAFQAICRAAVEVAGFASAWVVSADREVRVLAIAGGRRDGVETLVRDWAIGLPRVDGFPGTALRLRSPVVLDETADRTSLERLGSAVGRVGTRAVAALPVPVPSGPLAAFVLHSEDPHAFDAVTLSLLERLGESVARALAADGRAGQPGGREADHLEAELTHLAYHDPLTDLGNRRLLAEEAGRVLAAARRCGGGASLVLLDLDDFKKVNDTLGHAAGDELLRQLGERLRSSVLPSDVLVRLGGDEFAVLTASADPAAARSTARRILERLRAPFTIHDRHGLEHRVYLSGSVGIARYPHDADALEELMRQADIAMYRVKGSGGAYAFYDAAEDRYSSERLQVEAELRAALETNDFELHYQPVLDVGARELRGLEALVRWRHPTRGLLPPEAFVPIVEEAGLVVELDRAVLEAVVRQLAAWGDSRFFVAVNVSPLTLRDASLLTFIPDLARRHGADLSRLCLEITERVSAEPEALEVVQALNAMRVRIAVDDFGTGYSSLTYLSRYALDYLKIDREFVDGIGSNPNSEAIVRAVIAMAHELGVRVIAEGVEHAAQVDWLRAHGCDKLQGYLLAPPLAPEALAPYLLW